MVDRVIVHESQYDIGPEAPARLASGLLVE